MAFESVIMGLETQGWAVMPEFLAADTCAALVREIDALNAAGALKPAGVGRGDAFQIRTDIRTDLIHWLDEAELTPAQREAWTRLSDLRVAVSRGLYLGLRGYEGHLTLYPPSGAYAKHVDNFRGSSGRILSTIIYLNPDWQPADGGILRLYDRADDARVVAEVEPKAGTLACFISAEVPHEVLAARRPRYSCTGWFLDR